MTMKMVIKRCGTHSLQQGWYWSTYTNIQYDIFDVHPHDNYLKLCNIIARWVKKNFPRPLIEMLIVINSWQHGKKVLQIKNTNRLRSSTNVIILYSRKKNRAIVFHERKIIYNKNSCYLTLMLKLCLKFMGNKRIVCT
jgi:hypothetical protein